MKYRVLTKQILKALKTFPAIAITGPRQSGKTTLLKSLLKKSHSYVSLENPDVRLRARTDPKGFLGDIKRPVIIDEIQYVPELLSYIKSMIDEKRQAGDWVLTGSQNFVLMNKVTESLAGRVAVLSLLPFSWTERQGLGAKAKEPALWLRGLPRAQPREAGNDSKELADLILRGHYPEIASQTKVDRELWCGSYITTYIERDIRNLSQVGDLRDFERFLRLCAVRTGQILNLSELAKEVGIAAPTAKRWLSLLETGYQIFLLYPYYRNIGKRLIKSPKLYFNDTALASYLLGLNDRQTVLSSPHFGSLFESLLVADVWKRYLHAGKLPSFYYLKTRDNLEVDLVIEQNERLHLFEIKSSSTITPRHASSLLKASRDLAKITASASIVSRAGQDFMVARGIRNISWTKFLS